MKQETNGKNGSNDAFLLAKLAKYPTGNGNERFSREDLFGQNEKDGGWLATVCPRVAAVQTA